MALSSEPSLIAKARADLVGLEHNLNSIHEFYKGHDWYKGCRIFRDVARVFMTRPLVELSPEVAQNLPWLLQMRLCVRNEAPRGIFVWLEPKSEHSVESQVSAAHLGHIRMVQELLPRLQEVLRQQLNTLSNLPQTGPDYAQLLEQEKSAREQEKSAREQAERAKEQAEFARQKAEADKREAERERDEFGQLFDQLEANKQAEIEAAKRQTIESLDQQRKAELIEAHRIAPGLAEFHGKLQSLGEFLKQAVNEGKADLPLEERQKFFKSRPRDQQLLHEIDQLVFTPYPELRALSVEARGSVVVARLLGEVRALQAKTIQFLDEKFGFRALDLREGMRIDVANHDYEIADTVPHADPTKNECLARQDSYGYEIALSSDRAQRRVLRPARVFVYSVRAVSTAAPVASPLVEKSLPIGSADEWYEADWTGAMRSYKQSAVTVEVEPSFVERATEPLASEPQSGEESAPPSDEEASWAFDAPEGSPAQETKPLKFELTRDMARRDASFRTFAHFAKNAPPTAPVRAWLEVDGDARRFPFKAFQKNHLHFNEAKNWWQLELVGCNIPADVPTQARLTLVIADAQGGRGECRVTLK